MPHLYLRRILGDIISKLLCFYLRHSSHGLEILDQLANRWAKEAEVDGGVLEPDAIEDVALSFILYLHFLLLQNFIFLGKLLILLDKVAFLLLEYFFSSSILSTSSLLTASSSSRSSIFSA
ncbi:hypothetical protein ACOSQ2_008499 [Xanthoceras sorbifolium]